MTGATTTATDAKFTIFSVPSRVLCLQHAISRLWPAETMYCDPKVEHLIACCHDGDEVTGKLICLVSSPLCAFQLQGIALFYAISLAG
ncbi:hypothetical protein FKP32DRAFT_1592375 [Trametes sanguinea]|nr:hypothetical protein FKP32DRAFT_1592375 [Trametes sanguinea]